MYYIFVVFINLEKKLRIFYNNFEGFSIWISEGIICIRIDINYYRMLILKL